MNARLPRSPACVQPVAGARPPTVLIRWTNVVRLNLSPPVGPRSTPTAASRNHATASGRTNAGSVAKVATPVAAAHTALESFEDSHVARIAPRSLGLGFGLKKCVVTCWKESLNSVASGVNSDQSTPVPHGT